MAAVFEIFVSHPDASYAAQAARAAFDELDRLEGELSRFIESSDISRINAADSGESIILGLDAFDCLRQCGIIFRETNGVFDITIGPLIDLWRGNRTPSENEIAAVRRRIGLYRLHLDEDRHAARFDGEPPIVDLGGFGKGYALDAMAALLQDWDVLSAFLHGGGSTALALDPPPGMPGWPVTISNPFPPGQTLASLSLRHRALSASGMRKGRHIIDPRTAQPVLFNRAAWSGAPAAAEADALSTAFMVMTFDEIEQYCASHPNVKGAILMEENAQKENPLRYYGLWEIGK
ncbi:MAG: FAD:protein FMN transferase [Candidatus Omnitrophota bacterium]